MAALVDEHLDSKIWQSTLLYTTHEGHAVELAQRAIAKDADVVVAVGGDGSVNEVASVLVGSSVTLGIVPGGSGNGFGMHLGLSRNMSKALKVINQGHTIIVDTCFARERFFLNVAGIGFDGKVVSESRGQVKRGFQLYLKAALKGASGFQAADMTITVDGRSWSSTYMTAVVANASMYGYNFTIAPQASLQDGLFDLVLVKDAPRLKYLMASYRFFNRTTHKSPLVEIHRGKDISIEVDKEQHIHVDGEAYMTNGRLDFSMNPKSLRVIVPKSRKLAYPA